MYFEKKNPIVTWCRNNICSDLVQYSSKISLHKVQCLNWIHQTRLENFQSPIVGTPKFLVTVKKRRFCNAATKK